MLNHFCLHTVRPGGKDLGMGAFAVKKRNDRGEKVRRSHKTSGLPPPTESKGLGARRKENGEQRSFPLVKTLVERKGPTRKKNCSAYNGRAPKKIFSMPGLSQLHPDSWGGRNGGERKTKVESKVYWNDVWGQNEGGPGERASRGMLQKKCCLIRGSSTGAKRKTAMGRGREEIESVVA